MELATSQPILRKLQLPIGEIKQSVSGQGVSSATAALYEYAMQVLPTRPLRIMEAGSGSGVLSILLKQSNPRWQVFALEIQSHLHELAEANAAGLGLELILLNHDLRHYTAENSLDCIVANPPWQKLNCGLQSPVPERAVSRSELCCTMRDLLFFCERNLAKNGFALLLYPTLRRDEFYAELAKTPFTLVSCHAADRNSLIFHIVKG